MGVGAIAMGTMPPLEAPPARPTPKPYEQQWGRFMEDIERKISTGKLIRDDVDFETIAHHRRDGGDPASLKTEDYIEQPPDVPHLFDPPKPTGGFAKFAPVATTEQPEKTEAGTPIKGTRQLPTRPKKSDYDILLQAWAKYIKLVKRKERLGETNIDWEEIYRLRDANEYAPTTILKKDVAMKEEDWNVAAAAQELYPIPQGLAAKGVAALRDLRDARTKQPKHEDEFAKRQREWEDYFQKHQGKTLDRFELDRLRATGAYPPRDPILLRETPTVVHAPAIPKKSDLQMLRETWVEYIRKIKKRERGGEEDIDWERIYRMRDNDEFVPTTILKKRSFKVGEAERFDKAWRDYKESLGDLDDVWWEKLASMQDQGYNPPSNYPRLPGIGSGSAREMEALLHTKKEEMRPGPLGALEQATEDPSKTRTKYSTGYGMGTTGTESQTDVEMEEKLAEKKTGRTRRKLKKGPGRHETKRPPSLRVGSGPDPGDGDEGDDTQYTDPAIRPRGGGGDAARRLRRIERGGRNLQREQARMRDLLERMHQQPLQQPMVIRQPHQGIINYPVPVPVPSLGASAATTKAKDEGLKIYIKNVAKAVANEKKVRFKKTSDSKNKKRDLKKQYTSLKTETRKRIKTGKKSHYARENLKIMKLPVKQRKAARAKLKVELSKREKTLLKSLPSAAKMKLADLRKLITKAKQIKW